MPIRNCTRSKWPRTLQKLYLTALHSRSDPTNSLTGNASDERAKRAKRRGADRSVDKASTGSAVTVSDLVDKPRMDIGSLQHSEVAAASRILSRAFSDDPILTHYLYDPVRRQVALPAFFQGVLEQLMPSGQIFTASTDGDLIGVAAWLPPHPIEADEAALSRAAWAHQRVESLFPATFPTMMAGFEALEQLHPPTPHWYLAFVGIEPSAQRSGIGEALLSPVLRTADETITPCYLETPFPRTHAFYQRLGFSQTAEHDVFPGAPHGVMVFLRAPQPVHNL